jgi:hypothetical protein
MLSACLVSLCVIGSDREGYDVGGWVLGRVSYPRVPWSATIMRPHHAMRAWGSIMRCDAGERMMRSPARMMLFGVAADQVVKCDCTSVIRASVRLVGVGP